MAYPGLMKPVSGAETLLYETPKQAVDIIESIWRTPEEYRSVAQALAEHFSNTYAWPVRASQMDDRLVDLLDSH